MDTSITERGYAIFKEGNEALVAELKVALTVSPKVNPSMPMAEVRSFPVYRENTTKLYVPRHFGRAKFGPPNTVKLPRGDPAPRLQFSGTLRAEQQAPAEAFLKAAAERGGGLLILPCAFGKCLGRDTPVLRYDGTIVPVQDIQTGDLLMGDDSTPRTVLSICRGREALYRITPYDGGDAYVVNESHILSLKMIPKNRVIPLKEAAMPAHGRPLPTPGVPDAPVVDIPLRELLEMKKKIRGKEGIYYGYRVPVTFPARPIPSEAGALAPYAYGVAWANDATDPAHAGRLGAEYRANTAEIRLAVLAGISDTIGKSVSDGIKLSFAAESLLDDVLFLARTLGIAAFKSVKKAPPPPKVAEGAAPPTTIAGPRYTTLLHGPLLTKLPLKRLQLTNPRRALGAGGYGRVDTQVSTLNIVALGVGDYYGFTLDGNHRFLLGDCTVTHNTALSLYLSCQIGRKTLIVCHKEFLMNQWRERIADFVPTAKIGLIQQSVVNIEDCDYVLASLQSLSQKDYPADTFRSFGMVCLDECHHLGAEVFSRALFKLGAPVILGLSATPDRKDGLRRVFEWFIGPPAYEVRKRTETDLTVLVRRYYNDHPDYCTERKIFNGKPNSAGMINAVCAFPPRTELIVQLLTEILAAEPERKVILLSDRRSHLTEFHRRITEANLATVGYYVGGMKQVNLDRTAAECQIILATGAMANEGLDIPTLNTLVFASPVSSIEQPVGRIQRQKPADRVYTPMVLDIWDDFSLFRNQGMRRLAFYKKNGYDINMIGTDGEPMPEPEKAAATNAASASGSDSASSSLASTPTKRRPKRTGPKKPVTFLSDEDAPATAPACAPNAV